MSAFVRVSGPANENFVIGYPGVDATKARIVGTVEIRPRDGVTAPVLISRVDISLRRRNSINRTVDSLFQLPTARRDTTHPVCHELLLFKCAAGRESEPVYLMDLPFVLFLPNGHDTPPASLQLEKRAAETYYELVVTVQQPVTDMRRNEFLFDVPIRRYNTLSSFGMYNNPKTGEETADHLVKLSVNLPRWSYGPADPVSVYVQLTPNPDWLVRARKVKVQSITVSIVEETTYDRGDEAKLYSKDLARQEHQVKANLSDAGYSTNLGLVFPEKKLRDSDGLLPRSQRKFPMYAVSGFTTITDLYRIDYYLSVKAKLSSSRDIVLRMPIDVCPFDRTRCREELDAISQSVKEAEAVDIARPRAPPPTIIRADDPSGLLALGFAMVGSEKRPFIN